jgi:tetratricopeptide (TPR) repeat protein
MFCTLAFLLFLATAGEPASPQEVVNQALHDFQAGDNSAARSLLAVLLARDPDNVAAHDVLGLVLMRQRQFETAKQEFEAAVRLQPNLAASHTNLGNALVQLRRDEEARKEYQRSLAIDSQEEAALENLGLLEARAGRYDEAVNYLRRAHLLKPDHLNVLAALAAAFISNKKFSDAAALIPELSKAGAVAESSRYSLALLALAGGDPELGSKLAPADPKMQRAFQMAAIERAEALSAAKRYDDAIRVLTAVRNLGPQVADFHDLLGTIYYELDKPQPGIDELQTAIRLEPRNAEHYYKLGMMFLKHRTPEGALYVYQAGLHVLPNNPKLWLGLGLSNYIKGDLPTAKTNLYHVLSLQPRNGAAYTILCDLLSQSHADQEFLHVIDRAIEIQSDNYLLWYYYGHILAATNQKLAILKLRQSIRLNDQFPRSYYELGKVLAQTGNNSAAISALRRSIDLNPDLLEGHYQLGEIYRRAGQQNLAESQFAAVRSIQKDGTPEETVSRLLFTIEK